MKADLKSLSKSKLIEVISRLEAQLYESQQLINHYSKFSDKTPKEVLQDYFKTQEELVASEINKSSLNNVS